MLVLALGAPAASHAAPARASFFSGSSVAAGVLDRLSRWWDLFSAGWTADHGTASRRATTLEKNGCGIDPQGQPLCGAGTDATTAPPPADPGDLGTY